MALLGQASQTAMKCRIVGSSKSPDADSTNGGNPGDWLQLARQLGLKILVHPGLQEKRPTRERTSKVSVDADLVRNIDPDGIAGEIQNATVVGIRSRAFKLSH